MPAARKTKSKDKIDASLRAEDEGTVEAELADGGADAGQGSRATTPPPKVDPLDAGRQFEPHPFAVSLDSITSEHGNRPLRELLADLETVLPPHAYAEVCHRLLVENVLNTADIAHLVAYTRVLEEQGYDLQAFYPQYKLVSLGSSDGANPQPTTALMVYSPPSYSLLQSSDTSLLTLPLSSAEAKRMKEGKGPYILGGSTEGDYYTAMLHPGRIDDNTSFEDGLVQLRLVDHPDYHTSDEVLRVVTVDTQLLATGASQGPDPHAQADADTTTGDGKGDKGDKGGKGGKKGKKGKGTPEPPSTPVATEPVDIPVFGQEGRSTPDPARVLQLYVPIFLKVQNADGMWRNVEGYGQGSLPGFADNGLPRVAFLSPAVGAHSPGDLKNFGVSYYELQSAAAAKRAAEAAEAERLAAEEEEANKGKKGKKGKK